MKYLAALLLIVRRLLDRWDAVEKEAREDAAQIERDELEGDPGQFMADHFNGVHDDQRTTPSTDQAHTESRDH